MNRRVGNAQFTSHLCNWLAAGLSQPHGSEAFPGSGHQTAQEEEIRRLKRELDRVQKERDILKKPLGIFTRDQL